LIAKFLIKYIWECKTRFIIPELGHFWEFLNDKIMTLVCNNSKFRKLWEGSGLDQNMNMGGNNP
jgi:hypothetical protein